MGYLDRNDTLEFRDAYSQEEARLAKLVLGEDMMSERWIKSQEIYKELGISAKWSLMMVLIMKLEMK